MTALRDLDALLAGLHPVRRPGRYVFATVDGPLDERLHPVLTFTEDEGLTVVVPQDQADTVGLVYDLVTAWITLTVQSALDAVGMTAAVSGTLAEAGIACNVVAATHHDHLFVPADRADDAVRVLTALSAAAARGRSARH